MITFSNTYICGFGAAIRGMRNPKNSWERSDSYETNGEYVIGENDMKLMTTLVNAGTDHSKFMRMIIATVDITAPLYWWKEYDTYKVGTVADSCSTMHKIADHEFSLADFSCEHLVNSWTDNLYITCTMLNKAREKYIETGDKLYWWQMIQLLPTSYNQKRTVLLNYQVLRNMYHARKNHKLDEWHDFCEWVEILPYSELITGGVQ